jgi:hypothetical protein
MRPRIVLSSLSIVVAAGSVIGVSVARSGPSPCPATFGSAAAGASIVGRGVAVAALDPAALTLVEGDGDAARIPLAEGRRALLRHVDTRPGSGTVFVEDRKGPDRLVLLSEGTVRRLPSRGEVGHPALGPGGAVAWTEDLRRLRLRADGVDRSIPAPPDARAVFSPAFLGERRLLAVVEEEVPGVPHDSALDNLFEVDPVRERWTRLTDFRAGRDRWSAIRTPVVGRDGTVWFVRVVGRASATLRPVYELWRLDGEGTTRVGALRGEAYLAGALGGRLLWNVYDGRADGWRLSLGGPDGAVVACGAAMVDPRPASDPDLVDDGPVPAAVEVPAAADGTTAIVVGDFATRDEAQTVADRLGPGSMVVDHGSAPGAVAPGLFAAAVPVEPGVDASAALDGFRERFPEHAETSWIAMLGGAEEVGT